MFQGALYAALTMKLSRTSISIDETVELMLSYEDMGSPSVPEVPMPDGLMIVSTSRQESIINFQRELSIRYSIKASRTGSFTIGPFQLKTDDGTQKIPALDLTVTKANVIQSQEDLFVTLESSSDTALIRENIELTLTFYSRVNIGNMNILDFPSEGFELSQWQQIRSANKQIGQKVFRTQTFIARLTPTQSGEYSLDPTFKLDILESNDAFGMMFRSRTSKSVRLKLDEPVRLQVTSPPLDGRPEEFAGHLGNFRLKATVSPRQVTVGDPITLRVELSGTGSLQQALPPGMKESDDFKVYQPKLVTEDLQRDGQSGRKIIEQVIIPKHAKLNEVPSLEFSYYDTNLREYKTIQTGAFPINVLDNSQAAVTTTVSSLEGVGNLEEVTLLGDDLVYVKTKPGKLLILSDLQPGWGFVGGCTLPFTLWALGIFVGVRKEKRSDDTIRQRKQQAPRRLRKHLSQLEEADEYLYSRIWNTLSDYISDRLNLPPGEKSAQDLLVQLPATIQQATKQELQEWITTCEQARFAGGIVDTDREKILNVFRPFMLKLDTEWGR